MWLSQIWVIFIFEKLVTKTYKNSRPTIDLGLTKIQSVAPWEIASIFIILNLSDCHNRQRMSLASRASYKLGGQVPQKLEGTIS